MTAAPIAFQSMEGKFHFEGVSQLINAYAEKRGKDAKGPLSVLPCDGIVEATDVATGPCRGMLYMEDLDKLYTVHSSSVWKTTFDGTNFTTVRIGTIPGIDMVQMSRNQKADPELFIKTDAACYIVASDSVVTITDVDFPANVITADYYSGYTVVGREDRTFNISSINDSLSWANIDFDTFQNRAGKLVCIHEIGGEIVGFCSSWLEFWRDTGAADFPFSPISFRNRGLKSCNAVVNSNNTLMFPGDDGVIYQLNNYDPHRISNHAVERLISNDDGADSMFGFAWSHDGHVYANFTGSDWSRCYDSTTGVWHTRQTYHQDTWRGKFTAQAWDRIMIGDALTGKLGYLGNDTYTEFGDIMVWGVDSPPLHVFPNGAVVNAFHIDIATGYGLLNGQGSNPLVMLEVSKDGGNTFQQYRELSLGIQGKYATRVTARNLGKFGPKGIVFRIRISDPVARAIVNTDIELTPLKR